MLDLDTSDVLQENLCDQDRPALQEKKGSSGPKRQIGGGYAGPDGLPGKGMAT
jgi:hypothetical protein